ncbi:alpha/beta hydrolase [Kribbella sp. NPDC051718]|uniref:alpha/beta hydrolase n=1 Tax=Kribbella sp. NPDC051718 TaxID=3155168 RepID=UPI00341F0888
MTKNHLTRGAALVVATALLSAPLVTASAATPKLKWGACPDSAGAPRGVYCAKLLVPLDYSNPTGRQITLTLSANGSLSSPHFMLVNPGGPGASGIGTEKLVSAALPQAVADQYSVFSFDPRGVGASTPVDCGDLTKLSPHPALPYKPANAKQEQQRVALAKKVADQCGAKAKWLLPYITTENAARDMDRIRIALGKQKIDYLGYSYGTKLGATYATMFPQHVGRFILDSVVDPLVSTYQSGFEQNVALEQRTQQMFSWVAANDKTYHLGKTGQAVAKTWERIRAGLAAKPVSGKVGKPELDDMLASSMYTEDSWPTLLEAVTDYLKGNPEGLLSAADQLALGVDPAQLAYNCNDKGWPRTWSRWHRDTVRSDRLAPHYAWLNTWYSAPCAFWPVGPAKAERIGSSKVPPILLLQGRYDGPTPLVGAQRMQLVLPGSRLLVDAGGNHASYLFTDNPCTDIPAAKYWLTGKLPANGNCPASRPAA